MPNKINVYMLDELRSRFSDVENCVVVAYSGLTSAEMTDLRAAMRKDKGSLMVVKNTLASRAFKELGRDERFLVLLDGPIALAYGEDPGMLIRSMTDWDKKRKKLAFKGGMLGGRTIGEADVLNLAHMPSMPQMQGLAVWAIAAPITSFLNLCNEVIRSFIRVTDELARKQGGGEAAPAA
ncbi:MAG TPA: 50S ribosomal protein L10 [Planctomycetota bacterium]|nr:50S ribosomal protein L10 [Planctomycetota bacterium]